MAKEEEQDGVSIHSPSQAPRSSASSLPKSGVRSRNPSSSSTFTIDETHNVAAPIPKLEQSAENSLLSNMAKEEEQDGVSIHSPSQAPRSSASSLPKEQSQVDIELRLLQALEVYPPAKLQGIHRHFVLYGLIDYLQKCFERSFSAEEVLQLLNRFFNLEMLKPDEEEIDIFSKDEEFSLPQNLVVKEED